MTYALAVPQKMAMPYLFLRSTKPFTENILGATRVVARVKERLYERPFTDAPANRYAAESAA
jgi:hypothetical protein